MIEQKQLEGLKFRTTKRKETTEDGKRKVVPIERSLRVADILTETDHGTHVTIVTKDGRKYNLPPAGKSKGSGSGKGKEGEGSAAGPGAGGEE